MAKKKTEEAVYECVFSCTYNVPLQNGEFHNHFYKQIDEASSLDEAHLAVPQGAVVCKHFIPFNDTAKADRKAQIERPADYIETKREIAMIAEILVKEGFFSTRMAAEESIKETIDPSKLGDSDPEETKRIAGVADLLSKGEDDKERRKVLGALLKKAKVTYFPGSAPEKLAELVYDNGLYEAPKED